MVGARDTQSLLPVSNGHTHHHNGHHNHQHGKQESSSLINYLSNVSNQVTHLLQKTLSSQLVSDLHLGSVLPTCYSVPAVLEEGRRYSWVLQYILMVSMMTRTITITR